MSGHLIEIVPMRRRHLGPVVDIAARTHPRPWSRDLFVGELDLVASRAYVVAAEGRDVLGYAGIMLAADEAHVTTIAVDPDAQRRAIGMRLMLALARMALARHATAMTLEVRVSNRAAQELYRRFGFASVGARTGYYQDNGEDALVMWARDIDAPEYRALLDTYTERYGPTTRYDLVPVLGEARG
jgi:ribosomal-protein-alanine N-acetyltransferase